MPALHRFRTRLRLAHEVRILADVSLTQGQPAYDANMVY